MPLLPGTLRVSTFPSQHEEGISTGNAKCPLCGLTFRMRNLVGMTKWTAKEYAKWVYNYSKEGFWRKVSTFFKTWKGRLKLMGWTDEFWKVYGELKGSEQDEGGDTESFQDYVERKSQEAAEEWKQQDQTAGERAEIGEVS